MRSPPALNARARTAAGVPWTKQGRGGWVGQAEARSPDLSSILNEVLSYTRDPTVGPAVTLLIASSGIFRFKSFENGGEAGRCWLPLFKP